MSALLIPSKLRHTSNLSTVSNGLYARWGSSTERVGEESSCKALVIHDNKSPD